MKIKIKSGERITPKEFMTRWKKGVEQITPLQQTKTQLRFVWMMIIGLVGGIVICAMNIRTLWWLAIILLAGLGNTTVSLLGTRQKKKLLESFEVPLIDQKVEEIEKEVEKNNGL
jgi:hypothetical protein